jgi:hypothetical protein
MSRLISRRSFTAGSALGLAGVSHVPSEIRGSTLAIEAGTEIADQIADAPPSLR